MQTIERLLENFIEVAIACTNSDFGKIQILDDTSSTLKIAEHRRLPKRWLDYWTSIEADHDAGGTALERSMQVVIEDIAQSPIFMSTSDLDSLRKEGVCGVIATPIRDHSAKVIGMFSMYYKTLIKPDDRSLKILGMLAQQAGHLIDYANVQGKLKESEYRFRFALANSSIIIFNQDQELRYTWIYNPHVGFASEAILGKTDADLLPREEADRLTEIKRRVLTTGESVRQEVKTTIKGQPFFYDLTIEPLRDASSNIIGVTCVSIDITSFKMMSSLEESKNLAEMANKQKSYFLANMSHEIRTPLSAILGFSELLADPKINPSTQANYIATIKRNGEILTKVIDDILDLSKVELGNIVVDVRETRTNEILSDIRHTLQLKAQSKGLLLQFFCEAAVPDIIDTDPIRVRQILLNIVGNALKFTEHGTVVVQTTHSYTPSGEGELTFTVSDTGIGIKNENIDRMFSPFSQEDPSTRKFSNEMRQSLSEISVAS